MAGQVQTYTPDVAPISDNPDVRALADYVQQQFQLIAQSLVQTPFTQQAVLHVEPNKPRDGMIVNADGTDWNPGNGAGLYARVSGSWVWLGQQAQDLSGYLTKVDNLASVANAATALANLAGAPLTSPSLTGNPTAPTQAPGTNNTRLATTAYADAAVAALNVSGRLIAGTQLVMNPFAINTTQNQAHGLGQVPDYIGWQFVCLTSEFNWAVGDVAFPGAIQINGFSWGANATNTFVVTQGGGFRLVDKVAHTATVNGTAANWKLVMTPYKLS